MTNQACWCRGTSTRAIRPVFIHIGWLKLSAWDDGWEDGDAETKESAAPWDVICSETLDKGSVGCTLKEWIDGDAWCLATLTDLNWPELLIFATNVWLLLRWTCADLNESATSWSERTAEGTTWSEDAAGNFFEWTSLPCNQMHYLNYLSCKSSKTWVKNTKSIRHNAAQLLTGLQTMDFERPILLRLVVTWSAIVVFWKQIKKKIALAQVLAQPVLESNQSIQLYPC